MSINIKSVVRPTLIVRGVMYAHNKNMVFTNKYPTCRTVKCYFNPLECYFDPQVSLECLIKDITSALQAAGVREFKIKTRSPARSNWHRSSSIIVRIPFSEQAQ